MAYIGNTRKNGFWCPFLTKKNHCRRKKDNSICLGIELKNKKMSLDIPNQIEFCKENLLEYSNMKIAITVIKEINELLENVYREVKESDA